MQASVVIHYAGVAVARAEAMREVEGGDVFIVTKEPLPIGTLVGVSTPEEQFNGRVAHVVETVDGADNGMRVRRLGNGDPGANLWVPPPPAKPTPAPEHAAPVAQNTEPEKVEPAPAPETREVQAAPAEPVSAPEAPPVETAPAAPPVETAPAAAAAPETTAPEEAEPEPPRAEPESAKAEPNKAAPAAQAAVDHAAAPAETAPPERKAEQMPLIEDLPPARPTQGGNARRRTKRRK